MQSYGRLNRHILSLSRAGLEALIDKSRRGPNLKNHVDEETEKAVIDYDIKFTVYGQVRTSNELRKEGVFLSANGVRSTWLRHDLENFKAPWRIEISKFS